MHWMVSQTSCLHAIATKKQLTVSVHTLIKFQQFAQTMAHTTKGQNSVLQLNKNVQFNLEM